MGVHEAPAGVERVVHRRQRLAILEGEQQVVGPAVDARRRQTRVEVATRVAEHGQRFINQGVSRPARCGWAAIAARR
ncbi:MAG: hypothetical protein R3E34_10255 [Rhodocyclaceae bacterium]